MSVTCSKCGGGQFELASVTAAETTQQFQVLHCSACGQALGISEIDAMRHALREQQSALNDLKHQLHEVRDQIDKLANPA
jgi:hypothetical protein